MTANVDPTADHARHNDPYGDDFFLEPEPDLDTLRNLGPLAALAGVWEGSGGIDDHPVADGAGRDAFVERYELQPIDPQTSGPQLLYGLRYHVHIVKPGETATFHDQIGYFLWEPAAEMVMFSLSIPRGQVVLAGGPATASATEFQVEAIVGSETYGILSNPFLDRAFRTTSFRMKVTVHPDGTWAYDEETVLEIPGRAEPFIHRDSNTLTRVAAPTPNTRAL